MSVTKKHMSDLYTEIVQNTANAGESLQYCFDSADVHYSPESRDREDVDLYLSVAKKIFNEEVDSFYS